jgi:hypothetical protein
LLLRKHVLDLKIESIGLLDIGGKTRIKVRDHWEDQDVGGWTILKWIIREIGWDGMAWVDVAQDRDQ